eukprot:TRINITY_DN4603_c0_g1_i1.p1 TRINITY_DN4603_c0_g1~~TRINITY_DN4603_c0_g1_i1.p1  ORF type:complete len:618 (-),score=63.37 TRINITY_DN4603_c0_g1_i1:87-1940(-)
MQLEVAAYAGLNMVGFFVLAVFVANYLRAFLYRIEWLSELDSDSLLGSVVRGVKSQFFGRRKDDEEQAESIWRETHQLVDKRRVERFYLCSKHFGLVLPLFMIYRLTQAISIGHQKDHRIEELQSGHIFSAVAVMILCMLRDRFPLRHCLRAIDFVYTIVFGRLLLALIVLDCDVRMEYMPAHTAIRFVSSACVGNVKLTCILNTVYCFLSIAMCAREDAFPNNYAVTEIFLASSLAAVACFLEHIVFSEAKATVETRAAANVEATVRSVVSVLCDAYVRLGDPPLLPIQDASPHFRAMFAMNPNECSGVPFSHYVVEDDRERLLHKFSDESCDASGRHLAQSVHVRMIDTTGSPVQVQLLYTQNRSGDRGFFVGIRTVSDVAGAQNITTEMAMYDAADSARAQCLEASGLYGVDSSAGDSSLGSHGGEVIPVSAALAVADFNVLSESFPILGSNGIFSLIAGSNLFGESLLGMIRDPQNFQDRVQDGLNRALTLKKFPCWFDVGMVRVQPRHAQACGVEYVSACSVKIPQHPSSRIPQHPSSRTSVNEDGEESAEFSESLPVSDVVEALAKLESLEAQAVFMGLTMRVRRYHGESTGPLSVVINTATQARQDRLEL